MISMIRAAMAVLVLWAMSPGAVAQEAEPGPIAFHYVLTPKAGHEDAFLTAMQAHMQWRRENGETWQWACYEVAAGMEAQEVNFRSGGHRWADRDAYESSAFGQRAAEQFRSTVAPHLASSRMFVDQDDADISAWPTDGVNRPLIRLVQMRLEPGKRAAWLEAVTAIHAALQKNGFPRGYAFSWTVAGGPDPMVTLALPGAGWADFAEPDPNVYEVVVHELGEARAQELFAAYADAIESSESLIVRRNDEMSIIG